MRLTSRRRVGRGLPGRPPGVVAPPVKAGGRPFRGGSGGHGEVGRLPAGHRAEDGQLGEGVAADPAGPVGTPGDLAAGEQAGDGRAGAGVNPDAAAEVVLQRGHPESRVSWSRSNPWAIRESGHTAGRFCGTLFLKMGGVYSCQASPMMARFSTSLKGC
jgi:hypothetical protein